MYVKGDKFEHDKAIQTEITYVNESHLYYCLTITVLLSLLHPKKCSVNVITPFAALSDYSTNTDTTTASKKHKEFPVSFAHRTLLTELPERLFKMIRTCF